MAEIIVYLIALSLFIIPIMALKTAIDIDKD